MQPITWKELKEFVNNISEDRLNDNVLVSFEDESEARHMGEPFFLDDDIYAHPDDYEDSGTLKELKEIYQGDDSFNPDEYIIVGRKGTPFLWMD